MSIPQMTGITASADTVVYNLMTSPSKRTVQADGAIPVGTPVVVDTADTNAVKVIAGTSATGLALAGVYAGDAAAAAGDQIQIVHYGVVDALTDGSGTAIAAGDALSVNNSGKFVKVASPSAGVLYPAVAVEATSADGTTAVLIRIP